MYLGAASGYQQMIDAAMGKPMWLWASDTMRAKVSSSTRTQLDKTDFAPAANAGVNLVPIFDALIDAGATDTALLRFASMMADTSKDWAGQFGKYAKPETIGNNIALFFATGTTDLSKYAADRGSGGWLSKGTNLLDVFAPGVRVAAELSGRISNELTHRFQQWGIPTSWAENWGNALAPTVVPHHFVAYYSARQRGLSPTQARQFATDDAVRTAAAAAATYGIVVGYGAAASGVSASTQATAAGGAAAGGGGAAAIGGGGTAAAGGGGLLSSTSGLTGGFTSLVSGLFTPKSPSGGAVDPSTGFVPVPGSGSKPGGGSGGGIAPMPAWLSKTITFGLPAIVVLALIGGATSHQQQQRRRYA